MGKRLGFPMDHTPTASDANDRGVPRFTAGLLAGFDRRHDDVMRSIDRRVSVAPMLDWTDEAYFRFWISCLRQPRKACHLYDSPKLARLEEFRHGNTRESPVRRASCGVQVGKL